MKSLEQIRFIQEYNKKNVSLQKDVFMSDEKLLVE